MRMLRFFIAHEAKTQFRSMRFRGLAIAYVVLSLAAPVVIFAAGHRLATIVGPGALNAILLMQQPILTTLLGAILAVDSISRERDEGSFGVLSVAAISSTGYLVRRWLALIAVCLPITLLPTIITAAMSITSRAAVPMLWIFAAGWALSVLPALLASTAYAIALGTITSRTVLAIILGLVILTAGLGILNDLLFYLHVRLDGPGGILGGDQFHLHRIEWLIRGYFGDFPSDASYPVRSRLRSFLPRAGTGGPLFLMLFGCSVFYLRRTRRDLRPWQISETGQLRTIKRMFNRIREDFTPDSGSTMTDRVALTVAVVLSVSLVVYLLRRQSAFAVLGESRYAAETAPDAAVTNPSVIAHSLDVNAEVGPGGEVRSHVILVIRNHGDRAESHLSMDLNPMMAVSRVTADNGRLTTHRVWQRFELDLDPPLMAGGSRRLTLDLAGLAGEVDFALQPPGNFASRWHRWKTAPEPIYLTDLAQSTVNPDATETRMTLRASDIAPQLRYSPWQLQAGPNEEGFIPESILTSTAVHVRLRHPYPIVADSCGAVAHGMLDSRCTTALSSYSIFGGPLAERTIAPGVSLAYIPAHAQIARTHEQTFAGAVRLASESWPSLTLPPRIVFVERPQFAGESGWYNERSPSHTVRQIGSSGAMIMVPESIFTRTKAMNPQYFAAAILSGTLRGKRHVVNSEAAFFDRFYITVAIARLGLRKMRAVEPGALRDSGPPESLPLLRDSNQNARMTRVLADIEYRVGAQRFKEGIDEFVSAGTSAGTAKELLDTIGRHGNIDLSRAYADYFTGGSLPRLTLVDVEYRRVGGRWEVRGAVKNDGTGEAFVPVALRSSQGSLWQTIRVGSVERVPFSFTTDGDPRSVQLDPDQVCYRYAAIGTEGVVEYRGAS